MWAYVSCIKLINLLRFCGLYLRIGCIDFEIKSPCKWPRYIITPHEKKSSSKNVTFLRYWAKIVCMSKFNEKSTGLECMYFLRSTCTQVFEFLRYVQQLDISSNTYGHIVHQTVDDMSINNGPVVQKLTDDLSKTYELYVHTYKNHMSTYKNGMYTYKMVCTLTKWYVFMSRWICKVT